MYWIMQCYIVQIYEMRCDLGITLQTLLACVLVCILRFGQGSDFIGLSRSSFSSCRGSFVKVPSRLSDPGRDRKLLSSIRNERAIGFEY